MKVAVIGAGISGVVALKSCNEEGIEAVCYEMSPRIGGLWSPHKPALGVSTAYSRLITNASKEMMAFSDCPMPASWPTYVTPNYMASYIDLYCRKFNLKEQIKLLHKVVKLEKSSDHEITGCWDVTVKDLSQENSDPVTHRFDAVMVCSGVFAYPFIPSIPDMDVFKGKIMHSHFYTSHNMFRPDERVMVFGNKHSGCDIAADLCDRQPKLINGIDKSVTSYEKTKSISEEIETDDLAITALNIQSKVFNSVDKPVESVSPEVVYMSARSGVAVLRRIYSNPLDFALSFFSFSVMSCFPSIYRSLLYRMITKDFDYKKYNMPTPDMSKAGGFLVLNDDLARHLEAGLIKPVPEISKFTENGVVLSDGQAIDLDTVITATGYEVKIPYVSSELLNPDDWNLYKHVWPTNSTKNTLALIGHVRVMGPFPPISELQARWTVQIFKGMIQLPSAEVMKEQTLGHRPDSPGSLTHYITVSYLAYSQELARQIGCMPTFRSFLLRPSRLMRIYFGPMLPYLYRLVGPNKCPDAWSYLTSARSRINPSKAEVVASERRRENVMLAALVVLGAVVYFGSWSVAISFTCNLAREAYSTAKDAVRYVAEYFGRK